MSKKIVITEEQVRKALQKTINEGLSNISRQDYSRIQIKLEELENTLFESISEFQQIEKTIPGALKYPISRKLSAIGQYLNEARSEIGDIKEKIRTQKKKQHYQEMQEKKK